MKGECVTNCVNFNFGTGFSLRFKNQLSVSTHQASCVSALMIALFVARHSSIVSDSCVSDTTMLTAPDHWSDYVFDATRSMVTLSV